jgi:FkbM family methyltransferase
LTRTADFLIAADSGSGVVRLASARQPGTWAVGLPVVCSGADKVGPVRTLKRLLARNRHVYRWTRFGWHVLRFVLRRPHDPDFAGIARFAQRPGIFLDIGANTGQSAMSYRVFNRRAEILSIEPNPFNEPELRIVRRLLRRFSYLMCAAGDAPGMATLYVPVYRGLALSGEASLEHSNPGRSWWIQDTLGDSGVEMREMQVEVRRLDDLELAPAVVKIDVEGAEPAVLAGLVRTIERHRPVFLIEDADDVHEPVGRFFAERGYRTLEYRPAEDRFRPPTDRSARNLFYIPCEHAPPDVALPTAVSD